MTMIMITTISPFITELVQVLMQVFWVKWGRGQADLDRKRGRGQLCIKLEVVFHYFLLFQAFGLKVLLVTISTDFLQIRWTAVNLRHKSKLSLLINVGKRMERYMKWGHGWGRAAGFWAWPNFWLSEGSKGGGYLWEWLGYPWAWPNCCCSHSSLKQQIRMAEG